jgi:hypothetical protein
LFFLSICLFSFLAEKCYISIYPIKYDQMPLVATVYLRRKRHVSGKNYFYIHVPSKVSSDSQFLFREGEPLKMYVDPAKKRIILTRVSKRRARKKQR